MRIYLSGVISGRLKEDYEKEFADATTKLRADGISVVNPVEVDQTMYSAEVSWGTLLSRDIKIIAGDDIEAIVVLPGWESSKGAKLETFVGRLLDLPILAYPSLNPIELYKLEYTHALSPPPKDVAQFPFPLAPPLDTFGVSTITPLDTAESVQADAEWQPLLTAKKTPEGPIKRAQPLVHGDRQETYGHPADDFARTAGIWKSLFGWTVEPKDVPLAMIAVKLSRLRQSPEHEDSATDVAGYIEVYEMTIKR